LANPVVPDGRLAVILLPGLDGTGDLLKSFAAACPAEFEPVILDFPSDRVLTYEELHDLILGRLPRGRGLILVAESFAGPLALRLSLSRPSGAIGVVLCSSFVRSPVSSAWRWLPWSLLFRLAPCPGLLRRYLVGTKAEPTTVAAVTAAIVKVNPRVLAARIKAIIRLDASSALVACPAPLLYLHGDQDRLVRAFTVEALRSARPDMMVETLHAPHLLLQSVPNEAWRAIEAFVRQVSKE